MNQKQLFVPIKVQALVVEDGVIDRAGPTDDQGRLLAGDGKWSPLGVDYAPAAYSLDPVGPAPFFGARGHHSGRRTEPLVPPDDVLPKDQHRGVYLHWVLPPGLRHAYDADTLAFPPLPDQWLVVRFARRSAASNKRPPEARAWFIDGGRVSGDPASASLVVADEGGQRYVERRVGKVVPLDGSGSDVFDAGPRTTITAIGNHSTGSPTFTASVGENRNILSWHDDLADLRGSNGGEVPKDCALTYLVVGWYREAEHEPLKTIPKMLSAPQPFSVEANFIADLERGELSGGLREAFAERRIRLADEVSVSTQQDGIEWLIIDKENAQAFVARKQGEQLRISVHWPSFVLQALGWKTERTPPPDDLLQRGCLFHGMVGQIHYWDPDTYKGPLLGYPGAPSAHGGLRPARPSFRVGVGNTAADALVALVSNGQEEAQEGAALWKALEAVIYRQAGALISGWQEGPREHKVHQSWFTAQDGGKTWSIVPQERDEDQFLLNTGNRKPAVDPEPTADQLDQLEELNAAQARADQLARELAALQQDLYARWWRLCRVNLFEDDEWSDEEENDEEEGCATLARRVSALQSQLPGPLGAVKTKAAGLAVELERAGLQLRCDAAPRYWTPTDPVIVVQNVGRQTKHEFPKPLPCRLPDQIVTAYQIVTADEVADEERPQRLMGVVEAVKRHFPALSQGQAALIDEACIVEQALADLVSRTLPQGLAFDDEGTWQDWRNRLRTDLGLDSQAESGPRDAVSFEASDSPGPAPFLLTTLWGQQPWSPLFLDWQITWYPTPTTPRPDEGLDFSEAWRFEEYDYRPADGQPSQGKKYTLRGRSLLAPVAGRVFSDPLHELERLLEGHRTEADPEGQGEEETTFDPRVVEILSAFRPMWQASLKKLEEGGLLGQALSGLHQFFLRRDVTLPRVAPDPTYPWNRDGDSQCGDATVQGLLKPPMMPVFQRRPDEEQEPAQEQPLAVQRLAPPALGQHTVPFGLIRAGSFTIDALWIVDDFGQWADLLGGSSAGHSAGIVRNPHVHADWIQGDRPIAMPPRVVQPARLTFRFAAAVDDLTESENKGVTSPVCGWVFYNPLDQALALCDREGRLLGELVLVDEGSGRFTSRWECLAQPAPSDISVEGIKNRHMRAFARSLADETPHSDQKLLGLLDLIDGALGRIRPALARQGQRLGGRPLALVDAQVGLELFGKAWSDPGDAPPGERPAGSGDAALDRLRIPVALGCPRHAQDGLIGYYGPQAGFDRILPARLAEGEKNRAASTTGYVADPAEDGVRVGFDAPRPVTLLMDPHGSVGASAGILPTKSVILPPAYWERALAQMEVSFRVEPVLLHGERIAMPVPSSERGRWRFHGPQAGDPSVSIPPLDPKPHFDGAAAVATGGRLVLRQESENTP